MEAKAQAPETLLEAVRYFADEDTALAFIANLRWPDGPVCPECGAVDEASFIKTRRIWKCRACKKQFSVKLGTIFEDSPLPFSKWLPAMWMLANCKNGVSSYELSRALGVTQKTAWFMLHRIRLAMQAESFNKIDGEAEADETFIGGKARNMHKSKRDRVIKGTGGMGKVAVMGLLDRHGPDGSHVRASVIPTTRRNILHGQVRLHVEPGATPCLPTSGWTASTSTRSLTMRRSTRKARSIPTAWKTSGRCSSAPSRAPTSALSRSICSAIWTRKPSGSTTGRTPTVAGSCAPSYLPSTSGSPLTS
jgi:transposase-like protein